MIESLCAGTAATEQWVFDPWLKRRVQPTEAQLYFYTADVLCYSRTITGIRTNAVLGKLAGRKLIIPPFVRHMTLIAKTPVLTPHTHTPFLQLHRREPHRATFVWSSLWTVPHFSSTRFYGNSHLATSPLTSPPPLQLCRQWGQESAVL